MASQNAATPRTIITGTVPAARQLLAQHDASRRGEGRAVWEWPDIVPREAWIRRSWDECAWSDPAGTPVLLTRWQELALWEEAIRSSERDILLNAHATARAAAQAWRLLHAWEAPLDAAAFEQSEDSAAFAQWMKRVRKRLADGGWITAAELPGALHKRAAFGIWKPDAPPELWGFDEIAPADRRLFDAVGATAREFSVQASQPRLVICHDATNELTRAATWARQKIERRDIDQRDARIGIALPSLASVAAVAERVFDEILHPSFGFSRGPRAFEISSGAGLAESPMISTALALLRLIDGLPLEEAATLWRSAFIGLDREEGARLDIELRRARVDTVSVWTASVQRRFPDLAGLGLKRERARPSQWSEMFSRALGLAGWPGSRALTHSEVQTAEVWKDLLSEFARLDGVMESISRVRATTHLQRMAEGTRLPAEHSAAPVQILDIGDTAGTSFDALWIGGLHAGAWPGPVRPNPFVPLAVQRSANMPGSSAAREFAHAQRVTARLLASGSEVVCSYATRAPAGDKSERQQASPFLREFSLLPNASLAEADTGVGRVFLQRAAMETRPLEENLRLPAGTEQRGGASVLADQSACPFRAFAKHRLGAREMDELDIGLSPRDRGSLAHRTLEFVWKELAGSERLHEFTEEALSALIHSCTRAAIEKYFARHETSRALEAFRGLEQARLDRLIAKWLDIEKARRPFVVARNEDERRVEVNGLSLSLRVDRIDRYADGTHAIVDYKTSKKKLTPELWAGERPEEPQLPLYAVTTELDVAEVAFAQIATASQEWIGKKRPDLEVLIPEWDRVVRKLAADFMDGHAEVDPREKPSPCDLCALHALCRIHELKRWPRADVDSPESRDE